MVGTKMPQHQRNINIIHQLLGTQQAMGLEKLYREVFWEENQKYYKKRHDCTRCWSCRVASLWRFEFVNRSLQKTRQTANWSIKQVSSVQSTPGRLFLCVTEAYLLLLLFLFYDFAVTKTSQRDDKQNVSFILISWFHTLCKTWEQIPNFNRLHFFKYVTAVIRLHLYDNPHCMLSELAVNLWWWCRLQLRHFHLIFPDIKKQPNAWVGCHLKRQLFRHQSELWRRTAGIKHPGFEV